MNLNLLNDATSIALSIIGKPEDLNELDEKIVELKSSNHFIEALKCMERGLVLREHYYGFDSKELQDASILTAEYCNTLALQCLHQENLPICHLLLEKAENLLQINKKNLKINYKKYNSIQLIVLNSFACYYRKIGKYRVAFNYLEKALVIENSIKESESIVQVHLNICAVLSQLNKHHKALEHAQKALIILQEKNYLNNENEIKKSKDINNENNNNNNISKDLHQYYTILAISYHNTGVENEFLGNFTISLNFYKKAFHIATTYLGNENHLTLSFNKIVNETELEIKKRKEKEKDKVIFENARMDKDKLNTNEEVNVHKSVECNKNKNKIEKKNISAYSVKQDIVIKQNKNNIKYQLNSKNDNKKDNKKMEQVLIAYGNIGSITLCNLNNDNMNKSMIKKLNYNKFEDESISNDFNISMLISPREGERNLNENISISE